MGAVVACVDQIDREKAQAATLSGTHADKPQNVEEITDLESFFCDPHRVDRAVHAFGVRTQLFVALAPFSQLARLTSGVDSARQWRDVRAVAGRDKSPSFAGFHNGGRSRRKWRREESKI